MSRFRPKNCRKCNSEFQPRSSTDIWCKACKKKKCQSCGEEFFVSSPNKFKTQLYCSKSCQISGRDLQKDYTCERCGNLFKANSPTSKWCNDCKVFTCLNCGKPFQVEKIRDVSTIKFCSKKCLTEGRVTRVEHICKNCGGNFTSASAQSTFCKKCRTKVCQTCGKEYQVKPRRLKTSKFCSKDCRVKGDMNHIWTDEDFDFIKKNYPFNLSMREIAEKFDTSVSAIARLKHKLNLTDCPIELRQRRVGDALMLWTKEKIVVDIQNLNKSDVQLSSSNAQKNFPNLHTAACSRFGNWETAINAAGLNYDEINLYSNRVNWTVESIKAEILRLHQEGFDLKASNIRDTYGSLFNAARREPKLGSWEAAIEYCNLDYEDIAGSSWGEKSIGDDGNLYPSILECSVGNELFSLLELAEISDYYIQVPLTDERRWTCDFVVLLNSDEVIWFEVDGLGDSRREGAYGHEHEKISYYLNHNFEFYVVTKTGQLTEIIKKRTPNTA